MVCKSQIDELVALLHPRDGHPKVLAMIEAYMDESGIHAGSKFCVVAGYFGGPSQFKKLDKAWRAVLRAHSFKLEEFHAKDWIKNPGKYGPVLRELSTAIAKQQKLRPVSAIINVDDFNDFSLDQRRFITGAHIRGEKFASSGAPSKPYFMPFQHCIKRLASYAPVGGKVHFFFGLDRPFAEYANALLKQLKNDPIAPYADRLGMPAYPSAKETPSLQAADLLSYLSYLDIHRRVKDNDFDQQPDVLLRLCLNQMDREDCVYYNWEVINLMCTQPTLDSACRA